MADIVTLTLNPAVDIATSVERIVPFQKLRCSALSRDAGGGGINVARVLRRWKADVLAVYPKGGPTGTLLERLVTAEGVASHAIPSAHDTREDFTVYETSSGNQFRFVAPGYAVGDSEWQACLDALVAEPPHRFVIASSSLPPGMAADSYATIARIAKANGAKPVIDSSGPPLRAALDTGVYLAKPNLHELEDLTGKTLEDPAAQIEACRALTTGGAEIVALSLAEKGALAVTREQAWRAEPPKVRVVSTVGAGDSFLAAMIWRLAAGAALSEALRYAVAAGSAALLTPGTDLAHPADTEKLLPQVRIAEVP